MGRAKIRKARKQAAVIARKRKLPLDEAKKSLNVGWLRLTARTARRDRHHG